MYMNILMQEFDLLPSGKISKQSQITIFFFFSIAISNEPLNGPKKKLTIRLVKHYYWLTHSFVRGSINHSVNGHCPQGVFIYLAVTTYSL